MCAVHAIQAGAVAAFIISASSRCLGSSNSGDYSGGHTTYQDALR